MTGTGACTDHDPAGWDHDPDNSDRDPVGSDHTPADSDHDPAGSDHTPAGSDHDPDDSDHTPVGSDRDPDGLVLLIPKNPSEVTVWYSCNLSYISCHISCYNYPVPALPQIKVNEDFSKFTQ